MNRTTTKKKMAFSLISLITLLAVAFVVPSAMAGDFATTITVGGTANDISHADGIQLEIAQSLTLNVKFDQVVALAEAQAPAAAEVFAVGDVLVQTYTAKGALTTQAVTVGTIALGTPADGKNFVVPLTNIDTNTRTLYVQIAQGGVGAADPTVGDADDANAKAEVTVTFLPANPNGTPDVLKMALVGEPFAIITSETFQIHVLLSEEPKSGFNKDLLAVTDATVSSVVKLASPGASATVNGVTVRASWRDNRLHLYLVTLETQWGEKTVTIKVRNFAGTEKPSAGSAQEMYLRRADSALVEGRDILTLKTNKGVSNVSREPDPTGAQADSPGTDRPILVVEVTTTTKTTKATATETAKDEIPDTSVIIPKEGQIYISEIMFAGGGFLPQWIEIANGSRTEQVNLSGWTLMVENATADANVFVKAKAKFRIPEGTRIDPSGQHNTPSTILVVAKQGRNNLDGRMAAGQVVNLDISRSRHALLSDMAFKITLSPPARPIVPEQAAARAAATDVVGNLGVDGTATWILPMNADGGRSSIIRRHVPVSMGPAKLKDGEMMDSWVLASDMSLAEPMRLSGHSYYGFPTDIGTPGFRAGGALPVELSHFRPARSKETGAVVIMWSTQSELNNAGFFIKRSQQRDGEFQIINATLIPGAGTTSERQFYTYTDTTAQANVVYYYQIEDVSLDGNRQTLTRGIRLRGHVGAAGKATVLWGELKRTN